MGGGWFHSFHWVHWIHWGNGENGFIGGMVALGYREEVRKEICVKRE